MNKMNTREAWLAVYERAKQIRRANGFHHDLDPKAILPRFVVPGGPGTPGVLPYLCIPAHDDLPFPEVDEYEGAVKYQIRVPLVVFFPEKKGNDFSNCTAIDAWNWFDDLVRAFLPGEEERWRDLGCPVARSVVFLKKMIVADPVEGGCPHVTLEIGINLISSRDDLAA